MFHGCKATTTMAVTAMAEICWWWKKQKQRSEHRWRKCRLKQQFKNSQRTKLTEQQKKNKTKIKTNGRRWNITKWIQKLIFSTPKSNVETNTAGIKKHLPLSNRMSKWDRWTKDDESAMHPSERMPLAATCEGWRVRSGGAGPNQNQKPKSKETEAHEPFPIG